MTTIGKPTYEELEKKCALQQSKLAAINELMSVVEKASDIAKAGIEELQSQNADLAVQLANAESKCRELAAENTGLKQAITTHSQSTHFCEVCGKDDPCSTDDVCYALNETPATDAFLAEVRAQGVEMAIGHIEQTICPNHETILNEFAAQLRKGAAL